MRRIWTLDTAWFLTPRSSVWRGVCLAVFSLDEAEWWHRSCPSAWRASGSLTPDRSPCGGCTVRRLLTGQGISSGLPGGAVLLTQRATQQGPGPNLSPSQGSTCLQKARTHHHLQFSHRHSTPHNPGFRVLGKQLPAQRWSKEGGCFQPEPEVSLH